MIFRNLIFQPEVTKQDSPRAWCAIMRRPPKVIVNSSIDYSGLLITRTLHPYKHQLRDFFNRHAYSRQLICKPQVSFSLLDGVAASLSQTTGVISKSPRKDCVSIRST